MQTERLFEESYNRAVKIGKEFISELGVAKPAIEEKLLQSKEKDAEAELKAIKEPPLEDYFNNKREPGEGVVRINEKLTFRDDMYSLLFIANLNSKYKKACEDKK